MHLRSNITYVNSPLFALINGQDRNHIEMKLNVKFCWPEMSGHKANINTRQIYPNEYAFAFAFGMFGIAKLKMKPDSPCWHDLSAVDNQFPRRDFNGPSNVTKAVPHQCLPGRERCMRIAVQPFRPLQSSPTR